MKIKNLILSILTLVSIFSAKAAEDLTLWYSNPAEAWVEALPV